MSTAQRRLDLAVVIWALGDLNRAAVGSREGHIFEGRIAVSTGCIHSHIALVTGVGSHLILRWLFPRIDREDSEFSMAVRASGMPTLLIGWLERSIFGRVDRIGRALLAGTHRFQQAQCTI